MTTPPSPRQKRRRLTEDEIELWLSVAAGVTRRPGARLPDRLAVPAQPVPGIAQAAPPPPAAAPKIEKPKPPPLAPLERRLKQKLSRGTTPVDAAIDLHGLRQEEAHHALLHFLQRAQHQGAKVVIVVTGKGGRPSLTFESETGVLRRAVPLWLAMPAFRAIVVGFEEAARHHGGSGALYVRLRRRERLRDDD